MALITWEVLFKENVLDTYNIQYPGGCRWILLLLRPLAFVVFMLVASGFWLESLIHEYVATSNWFNATAEC